MKGIILILGSPNDDKGNLSEMAVGRNKKGIEEYLHHPRYKILLTGGFGEHFNTTKKPHAYYARQFLIKNGIPERDILEFAESRYTVEDALLSKPIVEHYGIERIVVVTSDFHMKRARYIFERVFDGFELEFSEAKTNFSPEEYQKLNAHEKKELERLKKEGIKK